MKIRSLLGIDIRNVFSVDKTYYTIYVLHLVKNSGDRPGSYLLRTELIYSLLFKSRSSTELTYHCL